MFTSPPGTGPDEYAPCIQHTGYIRDQISLSEIAEYRGAISILDAEEVEALIYFATSFRATPRIGIRFDEEDWAFFDPEDLCRTDGGNYRVKKATAVADGEDLLEMAGESIQFLLDDLPLLA